MSQAGCFKLALVGWPYHPDLTHCGQICPVSSLLLPFSLSLHPPPPPLNGSLCQHFAGNRDTRSCTSDSAASSIKITNKGISLPIES